MKSLSAKNQGKLLPNGAWLEPIHEMPLMAGIDDEDDDDGKTEEEEALHLKALSSYFQLSGIDDLEAAEDQEYRDAMRRTE